MGRATKNQGAVDASVKEFQSTPSVGRATASTPPGRKSRRISIHALRGEGDLIVQYGLARVLISIHALRGEGDIDLLVMNGKSHLISIHALRGEGDHIITDTAPYDVYFNPRPPWGGRLLKL